MPEDRAEMVTQLLFGDLVVVLDSTGMDIAGNWRKIRVQADGYEGWVDAKCLWALPADFLLPEPYLIPVTGLVAEISRMGRKPERVLLPPAARIPVTDSGRGWLRASLPGLEIRLRAHPHVGSGDVIDISGQFLGAPYLWGGKTPWGVDCSGLTQVCYRLAGCDILRDASQQVGQGMQVSFAQKRRGDLAFFRNGAGKIMHVGFVLPRGLIRHAHGWVRDDRLTEAGILNPAGEITHVLDCIKRFT